MANNADTNSLNSPTNILGPYSTGSASVRVKPPRPSRDNVPIRRSSEAAFRTKEYESIKNDPFEIQPKERRSRTMFGAHDTHATTNTWATSAHPTSRPTLAPHLRSVVDGMKVPPPRPARPSGLTLSLSADSVSEKSASTAATTIAQNPAIMNVISDYSLTLDLEEEEVTVFMNPSLTSSDDTTSVTPTLTSNDAVQSSTMTATITTCVTPPTTINPSTSPTPLDERSDGGVQAKPIAPRDENGRLSPQMVPVSYDITITITTTTKISPRPPVDKFGFVLDSRHPNANDDDDDATQTKKEALRAEKWLVMLSSWEDFKNNKPQLVKKRFRKGIPDRLRGEFYKVMTTTPQSRKELHEAYKVLVNQPSPCDIQIEKDTSRTFPQHIFFRDPESKGQQVLFNVLRAYSLYNKDIGYCQGMGFPAAVLLMYMVEEDAFAVLHGLMSKYNMASMYALGFPLLKQYFFIHQQLLQMYLPRIADHFAAEGIVVDMYATSWYTTMFGYSLPFKFVIRIWDVWLWEKEKFFFRAALALLKIHQTQLLNSDFEQLMKVLHSFQEIDIKPQALIKTALEFNISTKLLEQLKAEYAEFSKSQ